MGSTNTPNQPRPPPLPRSRPAERSCVICHRRKVRCDKQSPCSQCSHGGFSCVYPQPGPVRRVRKTTITDVASRISDLERTVAAVSHKQGRENNNNNNHNNNHSRSILPSRPTLDSTAATSEHAIDGREGLRQTGDGQAPSHHASALPAVTKSSHSTQAPSRTHAGHHLGDSRCDRRSHDEGDEVLLRKGTSSMYINEVLFSRVLEQENDVRSALSTPGQSSHPPTPSPFNPMGLLSRKCYDQSITSHLPSKAAAIHLWRMYVERVDVCTKILHIPTDEVTIYTVIDNPDNATAEAIALCYAVFFAAVVALEPAEVTTLLGDDKYTSLNRLKLGVEQALAHSEFLESPTICLLQALSIYLGAVRVHNAGRGIWILNGLAIRAAESIGLHRDGERLNLSVFESEVRRRLWWHLVYRDERAAEDHGFKDACGATLRRGVAVPQNLEDADLYPEMTERPLPRAGWTRMTLSLASYEVAQACGRLLEAAPDNLDQRTALREQFFRESNETMEKILRLCNYVVPEQRMAIRISRLVLRKIDLVYRHRENMGKPGDLATEENLLEALACLEEVEDICADDLLRPFRWYARSWPQFHMMLYILWHLCVRPQGPHTERALAAVEEHFRHSREADTCAANESRWIVLTALKSKAVAIMNSASKNNKPREVVVPEHQNTGNAQWMPMGGDAVLNDMQGDLLDWRTLLEEFQLDATDYSMF
ncbi:hypothetical protein NLU13_7217 [Sarocladium strictum]|uniref:Zn(2)-C6 fungal-type domain-containing protein n=1 Tax=Sarocladium strictum TaxID=5046 RepID=A0AA39L5L6_SARSR|nr:hypothetical protein NLU13_7217 [Sarocladium strictum]